MKEMAAACVPGAMMADECATGRTTGLQLGLVTVFERVYHLGL